MVGTSYRRVFLLIGGAQQDVGERGVGLANLAREICYHDPGVYCKFSEWHQWRDEADEILNFADPHAQVDLVGYSYGGDAALRVCRRLERRGRKVSTLLLCDAVRRLHWFLPASLWPYWVLRVPQNVRYCEVWRQRNDLWIRGHRVVRDGWQLHLHEHLVGPNYRHVHMDEHPEFCHAVRCLAYDAPVED